LKLALLLLSDIHFSQDNNPLLDKTDSLIKTIQGDMNGIDIIFLCIVGDSANTGFTDEYLIAIDFIDQLKIALSSLSKKVHILIVPGNHDCNFYDDQSIRNLLIEQVRNKSGDVTEEFVKNILNVQKEYREYEQYYLEGEESNHVYDHFLLKRYQYEISGKSITFNLLNTAWMSTRHEEPGNMVFPTEKIEKYIPNNTSDLSITLVHHHLRWLNPDNARIVEGFLTKNSHILISGHEHSPTNYIKTSLDNSLFFIECGALQDRYNHNNSEFQTIKIDLDNNTYKRKEFSWDKEVNIYYSKFETSWDDISNILLVQKGVAIRISDNFNETLIDPGAPFKHPRKQQLYLQDIFVYPDLKELLVDEKGNLTEYVDMADLLVSDVESSLVLTGYEKVGKTAILKHLFMDFYNLGYFPLFLTGDVFKKANEDNIQKKIEEAISYQYVGQHVIDQYTQIPIEKKIVLIDDWQKCSLNSNGKRLILDYLEQRSIRIIIATSDLQGARDLLTISHNENRKFRKFEINEFGHNKRAELIERWLLLGIEDSIQEAEIIKNKDWVEQQLRTLVRKGHVPSFPFFILTILQSLESSNPHQMKDSTKGHYYDVLIGDALSRMEFSNSDIDIMKNYISHLSYYIFQKYDIKGISNLEFKQLHESFNQKFELSLSFELFKDKLIKSSLIYKEYDMYKFKYPYVYFYFVAKYFADNIEQSSSKRLIREHITTMANNLFNDEFANILMFLIHLSKNEYILSQILSSAKISCSDVVEISLENEIDSINQLLISVPDMVIEEKSTVSQNRKEMHEHNDRIDRSLKNMEEVEPSTNEEFEVLEKINKINQGLKTIELIGQLLQSYPGYIEGANKRNLSDEAIKTGLRILNVFLDQVLTDKDYMLEETIYYLKSQNLDEDDEIIKEKAKNFLFNFCGWITFSVLKKNQGLWEVGIQKMLLKKLYLIIRMLLRG
jgi:predicted MPP superfamily phosphohydrolase